MTFQGKGGSWVSSLYFLASCRTEMVADAYLGLFSVVFLIFNRIIGTGYGPSKHSDHQDLLKVVSRPESMQPHPQSSVRLDQSGWRL
jgi:hypothetical protein